MVKIAIKVQNSKVYGEDEKGTWEDLLEEMALKVEGWAGYDVDESSYIGGARHMRGTLNDENFKPIYTFYAVVTAEWGEAEVGRLRGE